MRKVDMETRAVRVSPTTPSPLFMEKEPRRNFQTCSAWIIACWRHLNDLPVDKLGLALHLM
jgi:hypothetical protein